MRKIFFISLSAIAAYLTLSNETPLQESSSSAFSSASIVPVSSPALTASNGMLTRDNFDDSLRNLYERIDLAKYGLDFEIFRLGMVGYYSLDAEGALADKDLITIIDFGQPSTAKRFYTIDLKNKALKFHSYVAHGRNTGENVAKSFSNIPNSNQSSLGFYVTGETYVGSKGYSLRLDGMEKSFNDKIRDRAVVMHAADYATESWIKRYGRLGRSQGCPALPPQLSKKVIDTIKDRTPIFTYYPDQTYLQASKYLKVENLLAKLDENLMTPQSAAAGI